MIIKENIPKKDFINYIQTNWTNEEDKFWINMYINAYKDLGKSIGLYDNDMLIGFIYYKTDINIPYWYKTTQEKLNLLEYNNLWKNNLLEIHKDYRFKGLGSLLLNMLYDEMPNNYILILLSDHTKNHIKFYKKNGFILNEKYKNNKYYYFYKLKK